MAGKLKANVLVTTVDIPIVQTPGGRRIQSTPVFFPTVSDAKPFPVSLVESRTLWTDDTDAYFVRVDTAGVITWKTPAGNSSSAPGAGAKPVSLLNPLVSQSSYQATDNGTGYSTGDLINHVLVFDPTNGAVIGDYWLNTTTGAKIAAPDAAKIIGQADQQDDAQTKLDAIATAMGTAADSDSTATMIGLLKKIVANTTV